MLVAMAIPDNWRGSIDALSDGIGDAAGAADAPILGGDMSRATELSLTITVLGTARDVLARANARPGDRVYVTGKLGGSRAALLAFQSGREPGPADRDRFAHPVPRIAEAAWLAENGASAAIDISDGLAADAGHIASASRVRIDIDLDKVPVVEGVLPIDALRSGEEYEILATAAEDLDIEAFSRRFKVDLTKIGSVERGEAEVRVFSNGQQIEVPGGYLHFE
jgi:thiamine-monophosphate kinase